MIPTFANVRAVGFRANRCQFMLTNDFFDFLVTHTSAGSNPQPGWFAFDFGGDLGAVLYAVFDCCETLFSRKLFAAFGCLIGVVLHNSIMQNLP